MLLAVNGIGLLAVGESYLADFHSLRVQLGVGGVVAFVGIAFAFYLVLHEVVHLLWFPDRGLSRSTLVGILPWAFFVLFNAAITPHELKRSVRMPFVLLTPPLLLIALMFPGSLTINALVVHLLSCSGDLLLFRKLSGLKGVDQIWTTGTAVWFKLSEK